MKPFHQKVCKDVLTLHHITKEEKKKKKKEEQRLAPFHKM
jgi:hypothetical protein